MCNLYRIRHTRDEVAALFRARDVHATDIEKDYVAPGKHGHVIRDEACERLLDRMVWGFPPPPQVRAPVVNVRNYSSPFWRSALNNPVRRCLVPVTSFQEWTVESDPETGKKRPHWFSVPSQPTFAFAGVWRPLADGQCAYAFLTCGYDDPSTHAVGRIHPKACPVILHPED